MRAPLVARARADVIRDAEGGRERDAASRAGRRDAVCLEVLGVGAGRTGDASGGGVVNGDGERRRDVGCARACADESVGRRRVRLGEDRHRLRELREPVDDRLRDEANPSHRDDLTGHDAGPHVHAAGPEEDHGGRLHLAELHRRPRRRHGKTDADGARRHVEPANPRTHGVAQRAAKRSELGMERSKEKYVAGHRKASLSHSILSFRAALLLATSRASD